MKIKEVTEYTRLTDRAIRFYIEERLLSPSFTENYLGRRTFDFSEGDVKMLKEIATLRKFGVTVEEIRNMKENSTLIDVTVSRLKDRKRNSIDIESELLKRLDEFESASDI